MFWVFFFSPKIDLHISLGGFSDYETVSKKTKHAASLFLSENSDYKVNFEISSFQPSKYSSFVDLYTKTSIPFKNIEFIQFSQDSDFSSIITEEYARQSLEYNTTRYSLFLLNTSVPLYLQYGSSSDFSDCVILNARSSVCVRQFAQDTVTDIFEYIKAYIDTVLTPPVPANIKKSPESIVVPIISFGPVVKNTRIQRKMEELLPSSVNFVSIFSVHSMFDFPLISAGYSSSHKDIMIEALQTTKHLLGASISDEFSDKTVYPVYLLESSIPDIIVLESSAMVLCNDTNAEQLILSVLGTEIGGLPHEFRDNKHSFTYGHHPMYPTGCATSFSTTLKDIVIRNFIIADVREGERLANEAEKLITTLTTKYGEFNSTNNYSEERLHYEQLLNRTEERFATYEYDKALSSSKRLLEVAKTLYDTADIAIGRAMLFAKCCPVTYTIPRKTHWLSYAAYILLLVVLGYLFYRVYSIRKSKRSIRAFEM